MGRKLATDVHVIGPKGPFDFVVLAAGTEVPDEYADQVTAESAYAPEEADEPIVDAPDDDAPTGWAALTVDQLRAELEQRDLAHSGTKPVLIARLEDDDKHRAEESDTGSPADGSSESDPDGDTPDPVEGSPAS